MQEVVFYGIHRGLNKYQEIKINCGVNGVESEDWVQVAPNFNPNFNPTELSSFDTYSHISH